MDFIDQLKQFASRVENLKDQIATEEATKTSLILPFFQLLGYDIFDPTEFVPEFTADVGIKKGEKVDYAIFQNGIPIILIEAKWCGENLDKHSSQLFRYFGTSKAKFGILTNGLIYKFFTDLEEPNKMDEKPFMELNLLDIKESLVPELKKFHKSAMDIESVFNTASELKYSSLIKALLTKQLYDLEDNFVTYILGEVYDGKRTKATVDRFRVIVKRAYNQFLNETMNDRIKAAIGQSEKAVQEAAPTVEPIETVHNETEPQGSKIVTTLEELEYFFAIKSVLKDVVDPSRIFHRDTESYFGILLDDNKLKWICRISLNSAQKSIMIPDESKRPVRVQVSDVNDVYKLQQQLVEVTKRYL
ncbi:Restriction endonuclease, type I, R subunit/Type III [Syntrophobotulus glycolicus DSM 8271]|uniref:Restriction endonuclease, type I, R subunit/Type III n=1 Tax=Syntrophobotulus glycolicus (strain DSM 8271 / FlGlyR) TaxID=645991 RepID=F0SXD0_SYNGF|nr:type I restriction endonuclease [Syntrophobotulus glycolicus]ADY54676.1 Restriction endonuclease, type I, R subunit/Type III [Syntrophobotulus glycolicus DSM 8271]